MHSQCFDEIKVQRMQIIEETAGGVWGFTCFKEIVMEDCVAMEDSPSRICTLKALEEQLFDECKLLCID